MVVLIVRLAALGAAPVPALATDAAIADAEAHEMARTVRPAWASRSGPG
jgi:hypothetical protein